jgi:hypothetical protein
MSGLGCWLMSRSSADKRDRVVEALRQFARQHDRALVRVDAALGELHRVSHQHGVHCAVVHAGLSEPAAQQL